MMTHEPGIEALALNQCAVMNHTDIECAGGNEGLRHGKALQSEVGGEKSCSTWKKTHPLHRRGEKSSSTWKKKQRPPPQQPHS